MTALGRSINDARVNLTYSSTHCIVELESPRSTADVLRSTTRQFCLTGTVVMPFSKYPSTYLKQSIPAFVIVCVQQWMKTSRILSGPSGWIRLLVFS